MGKAPLDDDKMGYTGLLHFPCLVNILRPEHGVCHPVVRQMVQPESVNLGSPRDN